MENTDHVNALDPSEVQGKVYIEAGDPNYVPLTEEEAIKELYGTDIDLSKRHLFSNFIYGALGMAAGYLSNRSRPDVPITKEELELMEYRAQYLASEYQRATEEAKLAEEKLTRQTSRILDRIFTKPQTILNGSTILNGKTLIIPIQEGQSGSILGSTGSEIKLNYGVNIMIFGEEDTYQFNATGINIYDLSLLQILDEEDRREAITLILNTIPNLLPDQEWYQIMYDHENQVVLNSKIFPSDQEGDHLNSLREFIYNNLDIELTTPQ